MVAPSPQSPLPALGTTELLIPRTFHFVWLGGKPMPAEFVGFRRTWADHHPDWQIVVWDESTLPVLRNQAAFDALPTWSQKVDLASFEILLRHGGVYLDTDFECLKDIEPLLAGLDLFGASEDGVHTCHGIVGAVPGHPLIERIVDAFPQSIADHGHEGAAHATGPHHITRVVAAWRAEGHDATVFGPELFYPYHYTEKHRRHEVFPDAYAAHHWAGSWLPENQPAARRVVLDGDWADGATQRAILPVLATFCRLFGPADPVELVFATDPGGEAALGAIAGELLNAVAPGAELPMLVAKSRVETLSEPSELWITLCGEPGADAVAAAEAAARLVALHAGA
jgi:inositol phosphorylceramide mannosyltransferase catalytic subunit